MDPSTDALLADLNNTSGVVRARATEALWKLWFEQKGLVGLKQLQLAQQLLEADEDLQAEALLTQLIRNMPDFAEAWNRRAVIYYLKGQYQRAIADCMEVVRLNPIHFGALHGLGLCYAAIGDYRAAIQSFREALLIQPYSLENQQLILECTIRLS
ncbi:hypothetical protein DO97_17855 [Neosynechococcus sphagnicola sy1]|uniref:Uncharacterized protein n=1 Tax=Neosynechococcus sphagnicola sy1 TaxID=1497020 RepID=A0A098TL11_9CYAN|nr:tetratricopeptide repeat protein [Neosynechococcus sphagnicola]KGF71533.1 hypothetical protein DO97_17855 [Neosynechococcus sphagnicola sy1]